MAVGHALHTPQDFIDRARKVADERNEKQVQQRRRGTSFKEEYRLMKGITKGRARAPSMLHGVTRLMLPPQEPSAAGKLTVILDLDETLIYARTGPLYARPHLNLLFDFLRVHCETVVWTAGIKAYAQCIIKNIDPTGVIEHCIYRHKKWFTGRPGYQKDLTMLGRNMDNVLIIENTPDCVRGNPENGIIVQDYEGATPGSEQDPTIPRLTSFIAELVKSRQTVPEYLRTASLATKFRVPTSDGGYEVYALDFGEGPHPVKFNDAKPNLDLPLSNDINNDAPVTTPTPPPHPPPPPRTGLGATFHDDWINNVAL